MLQLVSVCVPVCRGLPPFDMTVGPRKERFMDAVREDMAVVEVTEDDAEDRTKWR